MAAVAETWTKRTTGFTYLQPGTPRIAGASNVKKKKKNLCILKIYPHVKLATRITLL